MKRFIGVLVVSALLLWSPVVAEGREAVSADCEAILKKTHHLIEADVRGLLPPDKKALLYELLRRKCATEEHIPLGGTLRRPDQIDQTARDAFNRGDYLRALMEWSSLATQGNRLGAYGVGLIYDGGYGIDKDQREAIKWYRLAAEAGYWLAQARLGEMYDNGWGTPENDEAAVKWFALAAAQGVTRAQIGLGRMFFSGEGVPQNISKAYALYNVAAANTRDPKAASLAATLKDALRPLMTPAQIVEAQKFSAKLFEQIHGR